MNVDRVGAPCASGSAALGRRPGDFERCVARTFSRDVSDWSTAESWLRQPEAQALLEAIAGGQDVDLIWSGDLIVRWSEAALAAGRELHAGVERALESGPGTPS
jgi:hypothetical protein